MREDLPDLFNPPSNFIASANNKAIKILNITFQTYGNRLQDMKE